MVNVTEKESVWVCVCVWGGGGVKEGRSGESEGDRIR